ncbi:ABC transporter substrate-binding protein [Halomonas sp. V046]|uniref:ABC transporter substrate-binding protein n=1 Tax=Halomonas sp. V046 TaxID=3459611 RepID=UPI004044E72C
MSQAKRRIAHRFGVALALELALAACLIVATMGAGVMALLGSAAWAGAASNAPEAAGENHVVVSAALDEEVVAPLLAAFRAAYPEIALDFEDRSTLDVDRSVVADDPPPDVVISSAMPWQMARVNQGLARRLDSPEARTWPEWAKWRDEVFGFTFEPIVMAYRLDLSRYMLPPQTHADLHQLLATQGERLNGRVTTYSPLTSGIGYTLLQQDARYSSRFWELVAAMGAVGTHLEGSTRAMLEGLSAGRYWLGYNLLGSYAMVYAQDHPEVIVQVPTDYSLVMMRMAFIHRDAPHPRAAATFVNFLLSHAGQRVLAGQTPLFSVRPGVVGPYTAARLRDQVGERLYPIPLNASLLAFVDSARRAAFMARWRDQFAKAAR